MPLENLLTLIEKLQDRINRHGDALRKSEALTRYTLIDPLLRELGWDTEDPALVKPEYGSGRGFADYALFSNDGPTMMLEAKKLDESLVGARRQAVDYAMDETGIKTRYLSVTDGACWEIYDTNKPVSDMLAASFDLKSPSAADACLKALALWRPSVVSGQIAGGATPVIGLPDDQQSTTEPRPAEETTVRSTSPTRGEGWQTLSEFNPEQGAQLPGEIMFPDSSCDSLKYQYEILTKVMYWFMEKGHLSENQCPIPRGPRTERPLVDTKPMISAGGEKSASAIKKIGLLYVDTHGDLGDRIKSTQTLAKHLNQDLTQFKVRFP